jgi:hypothetical protein
MDGRKPQITAIKIAGLKIETRNQDSPITKHEYYPFKIKRAKIVNER